MVELNYDLKSVRELQETLVGVGICANLIGFLALFLIPASISSQYYASVLVGLSPSVQTAIRQSLGIDDLPD